jgi:hypothetical protein
MIWQQASLLGKLKHAFKNRYLLRGPALHFYADTPEVRWMITRHKSRNFPHPTIYTLTHESHYATFSWDAQSGESASDLQRAAEDYYAQWKATTTNRVIAEQVAPR